MLPESGRLRKLLVRKSAKTESKAEDLLEVEPLVSWVRVMVLRVVFCALILPTLRECCISFCLTAYKRCDRLLNCEADFIKLFYPIYYNVIPYLLWLNVGKTKKSEFRAQISHADGSLIPGFVFGEKTSAWQT